MNSTNYIQSIQLGKYSTGETYDFKQIVRTNGTDHAHAIFSFGQWNEDISLELSQGVSTQSYQINDGQFDIEFRQSSLEPGVFHQRISGDNLGICIKNTVDLYLHIWTRNVFYKGCRELGFESTWVFDIQLDGPLLESDTITETDEESYDLGYREGYHIAVEEYTEVNNDLDTETLDEYKRIFPDWVNAQEIAASVFTCDVEVRISHPWPQEKSMTAIWAQQDCLNYDMVLTAIFDAEVDENLLGFTGAELSNKGCTKATYWGEGVFACEYILKARALPLGILFKNGFNPIFYTTEWRVTENFVPAYSWW